MNIENTPVYINGYRDGYAEGYADGLKMRNGTTGKGLDIPEAADEIPVPKFMDEMKKEVDKLWDSWTILRGKLCQVEKKVSNNREDINTLWDRYMDESGIRTNKPV